MSNSLHGLTQSKKPNTQMYMFEAFISLCHIAQWFSTFFSYDPQIMKNWCSRPPQTGPSTGGMAKG